LGRANRWRAKAARPNDGVFEIKLWKGWDLRWRVGDGMRLRYVWPELILILYVWWGLHKTDGQGAQVAEHFAKGHQLPRRAGQKGRGHLHPRCRNQWPVHPNRNSILTQNEEL
jgi:hypothetical protein